MAIRRTPVVEVFDHCKDAVVNISSTEVIEVRDPFGGMFEDIFQMPGAPSRSPGTRQVTRTSMGSGFVIHPDGYIVTNAHVVSRTNDRKVTFVDGSEYDADIVAIDPTKDIAILKIKADKPLPVLKLGRSDDLMIGETVIAVGNALGYQNTCTAGVVSAVGRELELAQDKDLHGLIQTDASINPGNSGGPLLNVFGELIGINTAIRADAQNIGFAIPVDQLREELPELLDIERRNRLIVGMSVGNFQAPVVTAVKADSPADESGVHAGDVVVSVDGKPVTQGVDFAIGIIDKHAGDKVSIGLTRDGVPKTAVLTLAQRPMPDGEKLAAQRLGVEVRELPQELARELRLPNDAGVVITTVAPDSPASRTGLQSMDVLVTMGRHAIQSVDALGLMLEDVKTGDQIPLTIVRADRRRIFQLRGDIQVN
ncbi:MAG TPA: trypsin-like peptidase domain-containing protein [Phycisphaerales bacterium]|nr:trypsin-like peptidase domain-containing protein [Phycisphaerales bacterium]